MFGELALAPGGPDHDSGLSLQHDVEGVGVLVDVDQALASLQLQERAGGRDLVEMGLSEAREERGLAEHARDELEMGVDGDLAHEASSLDGGSGDLTHGRFSCPDPGRRDPRTARAVATAGPSL